jgi:rod shape-determining protein MreC
LSQLKRNNHSLFAAETVTNIRLIFFVLISIALMTVDHRQHHLDDLRDALATLIYPLQYIIQLPFEGGSSLSRYLADRSTLLEENARLRQKQLLINAQLQKLTALEVENRRLRMLLESSANIQERVLIAELLTVDFDPYRHQILLNKGTRDGVHVGQPLLDEQGIIGQIIHVHTFTSMGILITDPNHAVPVQVNRNGLRTLAVGTGNFRELELPYIPNNGDIQVGDLLISSGLGGRFPRGYPVARVTRVEFDPGRPFAQIIARPTAQLDRSREILLIITSPATITRRLEQVEENQSSPDEAPGQTGEDEGLDPSGSGGPPSGETPAAPPVAPTGAADRP